MARRRCSRLLAVLVPVVTAGSLACGGGSALDLVITPTSEATVASTQPAQIPSGSPTPDPNETPTQEAGGDQEYTVQAGDTLGAIATRFGVTVDAIVQLNEITDPNVIMPGETLFIPAAP